MYPLPKVYIYTAIFGNYDYELPNVCVVGLKNYELIVFTDDVNSIEYKGEWRCVYAHKYFMDNKLNSGYIKCMSHYFFGDDCICIWIDANLYNVNINYEDLIHAITNSPISTVSHYVRNTIKQEAEVIVKCSLDTPSKVLTHIKKLSKYGGEEITGLSATMFLVRDLRYPKVRKINFIWFDMIYNGSRRDQLSFNFACWLHGVVPSSLGIDWRIDNKIFCRRSHANEINRVVRETIDNKIENFLSITFSQLTRPSLPQNYPPLVFYNEEWDIKTLSHIESLNTIVRNSNEQLEGSYCYMHLCTPAWKEIPDLRRSWKREFLRRALIGVDNVLKIGFNGGHSASIILSENHYIKLACVDIGEHLYSKPCAEYISNQFGERFKIIWINSCQLPSIKDFFCKNFDLWHIDGGHGKDNFKNDINLFLTYADKGARVLVDDAYVDYIRASLLSLESDGKIIECCQHILSSGENRLYIKK